MVRGDRLDGPERPGIPSSSPHWAAEIRAHLTVQPLTIPALHAVQLASHAGQATPLQDLRAAGLAPSAPGPQHIDGQMERLPGCKGGSFTGTWHLPNTKARPEYTEPEGRHPPSQIPQPAAKGLLYHLTSQEHGQGRQKSQAKTENTFPLGRVPVAPPKREGEPLSGCSEDTALTSSQSAIRGESGTCDVSTG